MWLRADARAVVEQNSPLIEQSFDVIGLDPPHSELVELLFGAEGRDSLVRLCTLRSSLLVLYQGHSTQRGRLDLVTNGLAEDGWVHRSILQVEEELIVVGSTAKGDEQSFRRLLGRIVEGIRTYVRHHDMSDIHADELYIA